MRTTSAPAANRRAPYSSITAAIVPARLSRIATALVAAGLLSAGLITPVMAQSPAELADLKRQLQSSLDAIRQLSERIKQLETAQAKPAAPDTVKQAERIDSLERQIAEVASAGSSRSSASDGVPLHGFADVGVSTAKRGDVNKGFNVGTFSLYLTPQIGERIKTLVELAFEVSKAGDLSTDLERAQIGYTFSDNATAWVGRFHTPVGYWNTAFHHGAQIQTSVRRPRFLDFEDKGGIMPMHTVGAWLSGAIPAGPGRVTYDTWVGNSPRISNQVLNFNFAGTTNHNLTTGLNIGYQFRDGALEGLRVGVHGTRARVDDDATPLNTQRTNMSGFYGFYDNDRWEGIAEYYKFKNRDLTTATGSFGSNAWFTQLGYRIAKFTPYARYEQSKLNQNDLYFASQDSGFSYHRSSVGLRYDIDPRMAVKLELANTSFRDRDPRTGREALLQFAIRF